MKYKVGKYTLDEEQSKIVEDKSKHLLVVAGAGSGKTLTILGKIKYLVNNKHIDPKEIICISFTAAASEDLKRKIRKDLDIELNVYTFHKLGLEILKRRYYFDIADAGLLDDMIKSFFREDVLNSKDTLKLILKYFKLKDKKEYKKFYDENYKEILSLEILISTFLNLFKSSNYELKDFLVFLDRAKLTLNIKKYKREKIVLSLAIAIYTKYKEYLEENNEVDFDGMLTEAKKYVDKFGYFHSVKYIIIDEYQDTSLVRFELIKSILASTGARLIAVGDDFQSIYRFTGCDLKLFLDFKKIFPDGKILKIQNTYRNSQELISVAGAFVMKNKSQMKKRLKSKKSIAKPIVVKELGDYKRDFKLLVQKIYEETKGEILVLGRNNRDYVPYLDSSFEYKDGVIIYKDNRSINIKYLTAHKSKGLEAENVIILNLRDDTLGFPNQMKDDSILRFVTAESSRYPFDEERRLFYVALTRTKNKTYLLVPKKNPSPFVTELLEDYKNKIEKI